MDVTLGNTNNTMNEVQKVSKCEEEVTVLGSSIDLEEGIAKYTHNTSETSFQFKQVSTGYQSFQDKEGDTEKARMEIEKNVKAELERDGEVNDVDTGHGQKCKDESEATANPKRPRDERTLCRWKPRLD